MYRKFAFEGDVHESLEAIPLGVRRKLDLAALRIPLEGWQQLPFEDRLALCHLPVDTDEEVDAYRVVLEAFTARADVELEPLPRAVPWRCAAVPGIVRDRLISVGTDLDDEDWVALADEERFALLKLADPRRAEWKFKALVAELGLAPIVAGPLVPELRPGTVPLA